jgi:DNA/RNA endonuclease YhcR with UshA esterase domain
MAECCLCNVVLEVVSPGGVELLIAEEQQQTLVMGDVVIIGGTAPIYDGDYEVTPRINVEQILQTDGKLMQDDVTVHEITISDVSNPQGGKTVTIGIL